MGFNFFSQGKVYYGAVDSKDQTRHQRLEDILEINPRQLSLTTLRKMNVERKSRQQKLSQKSLLNRTAKSYFDTLINFDQNPKTCARKLSCMKTLSDKCLDMKC